MTGERVHVSVDDVTSYWLAHATNTGFRNRQSGYRVHELNRTDLTSPVHISAGRYCADCPMPDCNSSAAAWTENPECCCLACGCVFKPEWPSRDTRLDAEAVLLQRDNPDHRNWRPWLETVDDLKTQNLVAAEPLPGGKPRKSASRAKVG